MAPDQRLPESTSERQAWMRRTQARWDAAAERWSAMLDRRSDEVAHELARMLQVLDLQPGARVLDAGCGGGHWTVGFALHGAEVVGVDIAPEMLRIAGEHIAAAGDDVAAACTLLQGSLLALPLPDASVDLVHCRCVLQFSPDPVTALAELARVLRPGGRAVVCVPGALSPIYAGSWKRFTTPASAQTSSYLLPWELEGLLTQAGWQIVDGWATVTRAGTGLANDLRDYPFDHLPRALQQAAATSWTCVCTPPTTASD